MVVFGFPFYTSPFLKLTCHIAHVCFVCFLGFNREEIVRRKWCGRDSKQQVPLAGLSGQTATVDSLPVNFFHIKRSKWSPSRERKEKLRNLPAMFGFISLTPE